METEMTNYVGILDGSGKNWGIRIPDRHGAYGAGATPDLAVSSVIKGLAARARGNSEGQ